MPTKKWKASKFSLKGLALTAAVEIGLLPEIGRDSVVGYDEKLLDRFWAKYITSAEEHRQDPISHKRKGRS